MANLRGVGMDLEGAAVNLDVAKADLEGAVADSEGSVVYAYATAGLNGAAAVPTSESNAATLAGFAIPRLGMGTMALAIEGRPDRDTAIRTIHAGLDAGIRYLDTAWSYYLPSVPGTGTPEDLGYGEKLVRDALATWDGPRDEVLVATKTGYRRTMDALPQPVQKEPAQRDFSQKSLIQDFSAESSVDGVCSDDTHFDGICHDSTHFDAARSNVNCPNITRPDRASADIPATSDIPATAPDSPDAHDDGRQHLQADGSQYGWMADSRPETMIRDVKESAAHLGVEAIDLLYSHGPDPAVPYEDQIGALKQLLDEGVIRHAGISRVDNEQIDIAREILGDGLVAVQNQFSPSHPDPEHTMEHCAELGLAFVCWSPLGGFLDAFDQRAYDPFRKIAADRGCSYQRVVLAWELSRYNRLFTIPSARNPQEINDSFAAVDMELAQEELDFLNLRF